MSERPSDEAVERMMAFFRSMFPNGAAATWSLPFEEARAIYETLPKPVDPAVLACRKIVAEDSIFADNVRQGLEDDSRSMKIALAAYHAGQAARSDT